jgi:hypothetical protein
LPHQRALAVALHLRRFGKELQRDELSARVTPLLQPIGIDRPWSIILGRGVDRGQKVRVVHRILDHRPNIDRAIHRPL